MIWQPASARYASRIAEISSAGTRRASIFMGRLYRSWRVCPTAEGWYEDFRSSFGGISTGTLLGSEECGTRKGNGQSKNKCKHQSPTLRKSANDGPPGRVKAMAKTPKVNGKGTGCRASPAATGGVFSIRAR